MAPRNDTLNVIIEDRINLNRCSENNIIENISKPCAPWQHHLQFVSLFCIIFIGSLAIYLTYKLCSSNSNSKEFKIKKDIRCISLCYFHCALIGYISWFFFAILVYGPMSVPGTGWEWVEDNGWIYEDTPGWQWNAVEDTWDWNSYSSWQWTNDGGWYYYGPHQWDITVGLIWNAFLLLGLIGTGATFAVAYLYHFKRLHNAFNATSYRLSNISINLHYLNAFLILISQIIITYQIFIADDVNIHKSQAICNSYMIIGFFAIMYQFNKRLLKLNKTTNQSSDIDLVEIVAKHTLLSILQLIILLLICIGNIIVQSVVAEKHGLERKMVPSEAVITGFWSAASIHITFASCMFLGFGGNKHFYGKLCFFCHQKLMKQCNKLSKTQTKKNQMEKVISDTGSHSPGQVELSSKNGSKTGADSTQSDQNTVTVTTVTSS